MTDELKPLIKPISDSRYDFQFDLGVFISPCSICTHRTDYLYYRDVCSSDYECKLKKEWEMKHL